MADENIGNTAPAAPVAQTPQGATNTPVPAVPATPAASANESNPYDDIFSQFEDLAPAPVVPPVATTPPAVVPPVVVPQVEPPAVTPPVVEIPQTPALTPEQILQNRQEADRKFTQALEQHYTIPAEVAEHFTPDQTKFFQAALVNVHKTVYSQMMNDLANVAPQYLQNQLQQQQQAQSIEQKFVTQFNKFDAKNKDHAAALRTAGIAVNTQQPNLTNEQRLNAIGKLTYVLLGIPVDEAPAAVQPPQNTPFPNIRANGGGSAQLPLPGSQQQEVNPYAQIYDEING